MNYFSLNINDYAGATDHLSILEDGIYFRLLRKYYDLEGPLPSEIRICQRLVRCSSKAERKAVVEILNEFFVLGDDGWHNRRADEEIAHFYHISNIARENGKASARARASRSNSVPTEGQRNSNGRSTGVQNPLPVRSNSVPTEGQRNSTTQYPIPNTQDINTNTAREELSSGDPVSRLMARLESGRPDEIQTNGMVKAKSTHFERQWISVFCLRYGEDRVAQAIDEVLGKKWFGTKEQIEESLKGKITATRGKSSARTATAIEHEAGGLVL